MAPKRGAQNQAVKHSFQMETFVFQWMLSIYDLMKWLMERALWLNILHTFQFCVREECINTQPKQGN